MPRALASSPGAPAGSAGRRHDPATGSRSSGTSSSTPGRSAPASWSVPGPSAPSGCARRQARVVDLVLARHCTSSQVAYRPPGPRPGHCLRTAAWASLRTSHTSAPAASGGSTAVRASKKCATVAASGCPGTPSRTARARPEACGAIRSSCSTDPSPNRRRCRTRGRRSARVQPVLQELQVVREQPGVLRPRDDVRTSRTRTRGRRVVVPGIAGVQQREPRHSSCIEKKPGSSKCSTSSAWPKPPMMNLTWAGVCSGPEYAGSRPPRRRTDRVVVERGVVSGRPGRRRGRPRSPARRPAGRVAGLPADARTRPAPSPGTRPGTGSCPRLRRAHPRKDSTARATQCPGSAAGCAARRPRWPRTVTAASGAGGAPGSVAVLPRLVVPEEVGVGQFSPAACCGGGVGAAGLEGARQHVLQVDRGLLPPVLRAELRPGRGNSGSCQRRASHAA